MRLFLSIPLLLLAGFVFGQESQTIRGSVVDSAGQVVPSAILVLMTREDSAQLKVDYCLDGDFELSWSDEENREVILYVSAVGYNSRYIPVERSISDMGKLILSPLSVYMGEVIVSARTPIGHSFSHGRDEYTVPEWLAEQSYDLNSLLMFIPGLILMGNNVEIAGAGRPVYVLNGHSPRPGELESLNPKDVEKVTVVRMPSARFDKGVVGVIYIETKKKWHDYFSVYVNDNFQCSNVVNNSSSLSVNFQKNRWVQFLYYSYNHAPDRFESWKSYETHIPDSNIHYRMDSDMEMSIKEGSHTLMYSPKYRFNPNSYFDVQYVFKASDNGDDNLVRTRFLDDKEPNLQSRTFSDERQKMHRVALRYDNRFGKEQEQRVTVNTSYMNSLSKDESRLEEEQFLLTEPLDTTFTQFRQSFRNEVLTSSIQGEFILWDALEVETGVSYGNLWTRSMIDYLTKDYVSRRRTHNEQAAFYLHANHQLGRFQYQLGVRGEYERRNASNAVGEDVFYFLPNVGASYRVNDKLNFMLSYRRMVEYPMTEQLNTNILYFHKYMYHTGNELLRPTVTNAFMANCSFPLNFMLTCKYDYQKDNIVLSTLTDADDPNILILTPQNLDKTHRVELNLTWSRMFGRYYLSLVANYMESFVRSRFIEKPYSKPKFAFNAVHSFNINSHIRAVVGMYYSTPYGMDNIAHKAYYTITPQLHVNLLKNRLNIKIMGENLIYAGNYYEKDTYNHTTTISDSNFHERRFSVGISYNFNNFRELFRKNEAGSDMMKRAGVGE